MTRGTPTYPDAPLAGPRGRSTGSVLAPRPFSRALAAGVAAELLIGVLDIVFGTQVIVAATLVLPPLVVALTGRWGDTVVISGLAVALAVMSALVHSGDEDWDNVLALLLVPAGGAVAIAVALVRTGTAVALERFRLLVGVAEAADAAAGPEAFADAVLELLVPRFGDACAIDVEPDGERRRLGARGDGSLLSSSDAGALALRVPLRARGRVFGALSCALGPSGRRYSVADARFAGVLAGRVALALDNAGLTSELSVAEEQLSAVVRTLAEAVTVTDAQGQIVYANEAAVELLRVESVEDLLERRAGRGHGPLRRLRRGRGPGRPASRCPASGCWPASATCRRCWCATSSWPPARSAGCSTRSRACTTRRARDPRRERDRGRDGGQARRARAAPAGGRG